jgi:hypothetical protein
VISAPTLVTSTNPATATPITFPGATPPKPTKDEEEEIWRSKYLEARIKYRKVKAQIREQAKKSRQLIVAVKTKLQEEESQRSMVM